MHSSAHLARQCSVAQELASYPTHSEVQTSLSRRCFQARVAHAGAKFARTSKHATWDAKISEERNFALFKWIRIVERGSWDFAVSRDFLKARLVGQGAGTLFDSVSDALAAKSTATLQGRAGALLRYIYFCESEDLEPFPVREEIVYKFFHAMQTRAAATFFKSVLSSMAFAKFSLGLESADFALCASQALQRSFTLASANCSRGLL